MPRVKNQPLPSHQMDLHADSDGNSVSILYLLLLVRPRIHSDDAPSNIFKFSIKLYLPVNRAPVLQSINPVAPLVIFTADVRDVDCYADDDDFQMMIGNVRLDMKFPHDDDCAVVPVFGLFSEDKE